MNNKYVLAFMAVLFQLIAQTLMKGGLGYTEEGVLVIPEWAERMGARPIGAGADALESGWQILIADVLTNIPLLAGFLFMLLYALSLVVLTSKAGLAFVNSMIMIVMVLISFVSFILFGEYFGELKFVGMLIIVTGFILVIAGEREAETKGYIE